MSRLLEGLAELLFPTRCAGCERPGELLCDACLAAMSLIPAGEACPVCGAPAESAQRGESCLECRGRGFAFSAARCAGLLDGVLARSIVLFKDAGERRLSEPLGTLLAEAVGEWREWAEALVPVPASAAALRRRGFDHAALLAEEVSVCTDVAVLRGLARGSAADQRGLSREQRAANVARALSVRPGVSVPERALLLDDVFTTGATLDAASRALLSAGTLEVRVVTLARKVSTA